MDVFRDSWNNFKGTVRGFDTPHQLGVGMALGVAAGLIPLDSALPYIIALVALLSTSNLLCFGIGATLAHFVSPSLDHLTHIIGTWVLTFDPLEATWATLASSPVVPWTRFNNSVVMGTLVLGLIAATPIYSITRITSQKIGYWISTKWRPQTSIASQGRAEA
jgi:uncharacterized protein (TIGR03546 family)